MPARVAVLGIQLEANAWAPSTMQRDFEHFGLWVGEAAREVIDNEQLFGLARGLSPHRNWEAVPILLARGEAGGPVEHAVFEALVGTMRAELAAAAPLDAVFIDAHGGGTTTALDDMDGAYFRAVREVVGPRIPVVGTLDMHGNVSPEMVAATDLLVAQRTNPHLDTLDRQAEAGRLLHRLMDGHRLFKAAVRVPLLTPQVTQLTAPGEPLGDLMSLVEARIGGDIASLSLLPGFALSDTPDNGVTVLAYAWSHQAAADAAAAEIAREVWRARDRFRRELKSIDQAVELAKRAMVDRSKSPIILADVADNPGGGASGNTVWIMKALHQAGATGVQIGLIHDPALAEEAACLGVGARFRACFNRAQTPELSGCYEADAVVKAARDVRVVSERGVLAGSVVDLGRTCALDLGGVEVAVVSARHQLWEAGLLDACGLDSRLARTFVAKSRGHFRAGFAHLVGAENIHEIDAPGLTTPNLNQLTWKRLRRPIYPLDTVTDWSPCQAV